MRQYFFGTMILLFSVMIQLSSTFAQQLQPSTECMECHRSVYAEWRGSAHAHSSEWTNPLYRKMVEWAERSGGEAVAESCRDCHQPAQPFESEISVPMSVIQEGIGCDFCHSVQLDKKSNSRKFEVITDGTKLGPLKDAISGAHKSAFSEDHITSEFCLVCHSTFTPSDLTFCSSENEWQEFIKANTRIECQDCHMPTLEGRAAILGKIRDEIHSHAFWGGYSTKMLHSAVDLNLTANVQNNIVHVEIGVNNRGAGHYVPTGSPMRFVVLEVIAKDAEGEIIWRNWQTNPIAEDPAAVFMRLLENADGQAPVPPWEAVRERFDQRLRPNQPRKLVYSIPDYNVSLIEARLVYRPAPPALLRRLTIIEERYINQRIMAEEVAVPYKRNEDNNK